MQRNLALTGCLLCLPFLGGCFPYYAFPAVDYTPSVRVTAPAGEVRAFRADVTGKGVLTFGGFIDVPPERLWKLDETTSLCLAELPLTDAEKVPAQVKPSMSYGYAIPILVVNALIHTRHSLALRLYRRGYELVEIDSWGSVKEVEWKPAGDLEDQVTALDRLLTGYQETGPLSPAHRDALLFGAAEYERLAEEAQTTEQQRRLLYQANDLREVVKEAAAKKQ